VPPDDPQSNYLIAVAVAVVRAWHDPGRLLEQCRRGRPTRRHSRHRRVAGPGRSARGGARGSVRVGVLRSEAGRAPRRRDIEGGLTPVQNPPSSRRSGAHKLRRGSRVKTPRGRIIAVLRARSAWHAIRVPVEHGAAVPARRTEVPSPARAVPGGHRAPRDLPRRHGSSPVRLSPIRPRSPVPPLSCVAQPRWCREVSSDSRISTRLTGG